MGNLKKMAMFNSYMLNYQRVVVVDGFMNSESSWWIHDWNASPFNPATRHILPAFVVVRAPSLPWSWVREWWLRLTKLTWAYISGCICICKGSVSVSSSKVIPYIYIYMCVCVCICYKTNEFGGIPFASHEQSKLPCNMPWKSSPVGIPSETTWRLWLLRDRLQQSHCPYWYTLSTELSVQEISG